MFGSSTEEVEWWESGEVGVKDLVVKEDKCLEIKRIKVGFLEYIIRVSDFQYVKMEAGEDLIKTTDGAGVVISFYSLFLVRLQELGAHCIITNAEDGGDGGCVSDGGDGGYRWLSMAEDGGDDDT